MEQVMQEFQKSEKERLEEPPLVIGLEMLCAMVMLSDHSPFSLGEFLQEFSIRLSNTDSD